ncbi:MAG: hypothetical protein O3A80_01985 [bacterium]|nr:hypothetical protein [bacterium]MDA1292175.1 hypothetical protein [bacterium]
MKEIQRTSNERPYFQKITEGVLTGAPFGFIMSDRGLELKYQRDASRHMEEVSNYLQVIARSSVEFPIFEQIHEGKVELTEAIYNCINDTNQQIAESLRSGLREAADLQAGAIMESGFAISNAIAYLADSILEGDKKIAKALSKIAKVKKYQGTSSHEVLLDEVESINRAERSRAEKLKSLLEGMAISTHMGELNPDEADLLYSLYEAEAQAFFEAINCRRESLWNLIHQRMESGHTPKDGADIALKKVVFNLHAHESAFRVMDDDPRGNNRTREIIGQQIDQYRSFIERQTGIRLEDVNWSAPDVRTVKNTMQISKELQDSDRMQELMTQKLDEDSVTYYVLSQGSSNPLYKEALGNKRNMGLMRFLIENDPDNPRTEELIKESYFHATEIWIETMRLLLHRDEPHPLQLHAFEKMENNFLHHQDSFCSRQNFLAGINPSAFTHVDRSVNSKLFQNTESSVVNAFFAAKCAEYFMINNKFESASSKLDAAGRINRDNLDSDDKKRVYDELAVYTERIKGPIREGVEEQRFANKRKEDLNRELASLHIKNKVIVDEAYNLGLDGQNMINQGYYGDAEDFIRRLGIVLQDSNSLFLREGSNEERMWNEMPSRFSRLNAALQNARNIWMENRKKTFFQFKLEQKKVSIF